MRVDEGGVPVRVLAAMWLLVFVIGLYDIAQRIETSGHDRGHSSSRAGSAAILLGGGLGTAALFIAPLGLYDSHTRGSAALGLAAAGLPLILVCVGAVRALHAGKAAPAPWALLGYVSAVMLLVTGILSLLREEVRSMDSYGANHVVTTTQQPLIDPLGTFASSFFGVFVLWVFITGILVWRVERTPEYGF